MKRLAFIILIFTLVFFVDGFAQHRNVSGPSLTKAAKQTALKSNQKASTTKKKPSPTSTGKKKTKKKSPKKEEVIDLSIIVSGSHNGVDYVDLGLPSGNKWSVCNLGADAPIDAGAPFEWGAIMPYQEGYTTPNLYNSTGFYISGNSDYDPARYHLEGRWSMPSASDFEELGENCDFIFMDEDGYLFQNDDSFYALVIGPNGNIMFLPYVMLADDDEESFDMFGPYWTASPVDYSKTESLAFIINNEELYINEVPRNVCMMIRPILRR